MIKAIVTDKLVGMLIRHTMTAIGGVMIADGYVDESAWQAITGGAVALGGVVLSGVEKAFR